MLELKTFDESREVVLQFEHSLLSVSKWEQKFKKPFSSVATRKPSELIEYFQMMLLSTDVDPDLVITLRPDQLDEIVEYINDVPSATKATNEPGPKNQQVITNEVVYAWMVQLKIPFEAQTWHLNRLMVLIETISYQKQPPKKRHPREVLTDWVRQNEERKKKYNTTG